MDHKVELPFGAPPILPDVEKQLREYILNPERLPIHDYETSQQHWSRTANAANLYHYELSQAGTTLKVERDLTTGESVGFKEIYNNGEPLNQDLKIDIDEIAKILEGVNDDDLGLNDELMTVPPWFSRGVDLKENQSVESDGKSEKPYIINLVNVLKDDTTFLKLWEKKEEENKEETSEKKEIVNNQTVEDSEIINTIPEEVKFSAPVLRISDVKPLREKTSTEWAQMIDVSQPVTDFHERIPDMAFKYNFELDTFQKQAILKLEEHNNVLVSAHTSAGKTVVAEYAIALSQRHMTRTIYTSPIKALSNQKYRDFRKTFKDVGLITGDFQVNATGTCLIMTTEILRSMLLAQNEIIRDLEYVIFDEVHYINDIDRGHVWEEVIILLPPHVCIVMLSATVPNALQFADWVGRTKQRKMFVISTTHRPVPLEHYLYTGSGGSSQDERFLILSAKNELQPTGYAKAVEAKKKRASAKSYIQGGAKQETTMWVALLQHLKKHDKLPVVAFTLSRKRCDQNAECLSSMDLTTAKEKSHVKHFVRQSIQRLKEADQQLPQIIQMQRLLENGIGVHHSGILPILKEIVEMLFQERCVKVLFATETFAMGVNMPAKTVVFDSIMKFDGLEDRILLPSEYIQMAGRAGRRGLDDTGTVIIICKKDVPPYQDLEMMMRGNPRKIESQFRLTYSIILKLERKRVAAEGKVTVEEMMAHSFKEANHVKMKKTYTENLAKVEKDLSAIENSVQRGSAWDQLCNICRNCIRYLEKWKEISPKIFIDKQNLKTVVPGRVVLVTHKSHVNKLGILLLCDYKRELKFRVLVLDDKRKKDDSVTDDDWYKVLALTQRDKIFEPETIGDHQVLTIDPWDILEVTNLTVKVDSKIVLGDWDNRQIPRFKDNPPGQTFKRTLEELTELTRNVKLKNVKLDFLNVFQDVKISTSEDMELIKDIKTLKITIKSFSTDSIINFEEQVKEVFRVKVLEMKKENLEYLLSYQSMSLYADYQSRLDVLRELKYVDNKNSVQMKGNVACEISNHELLITELVLRNALNDLQPAEIAALLSCFVYQGKKENQELLLTASLKKGIETIKQVAKEVFQAEKKYGVSQVDASGNEENLNFDLVPVVYEWAREKPFSEIMTLTEIQEGIIVRCIQQLNETIRDVKDAARIIGEPTLQQKMEDASNAIKRDIVFAASLYMQ